MYAGRKSEMLAFLPTVVIYRLFPWSLEEKKTRKMLVFFSVFFVHLPLNMNANCNEIDHCNVKYAFYDLLKISSKLVIG